ncbi:bifunctional 5,10-methylenetetrahydrofolate dehydrogenase/5,10-methenyltetrahydrofolate cyclohydrolase [Veillonella caviae]|uniref:bifunctional 5,10-methylenetetrahydrofolate dehydrogenase/5,10-methenyltetrahydrofolate cyclohydrolase n=1 Tax=Veillonella caviae TaxID=248316 RepID=UPI002A91121A|nr:bifunctional 5,10-methylenetetrahydrofolate dehydrogenase/5,10-methenyltetrahydrofolate cyclohydrolase [Veillonella caviae]MDD7291367.1 bifunctional 5,10-methylenetetrahydrofolate dehydrogenase/5,10-methenyltetrahydrofolate cyclohydrolase [Veillonella caviae]MDY5787077.1 bifunctional 5,10-methylenetetrahydrofolate dehydrogenase/5,10-methenyltetrahydrofolate cyclohydrolase [Veillonella caviae]
MLELRGKAVADAHKTILQEKMTSIGEGVITMAILLVGDDHGANMYADFMEKTAKNFGYGFVRKQLPATVTNEEVFAALTDLNNDDAVHGILPLMPMPKHIDTEALIDALNPKKDIDGLTTHNIGLVTAGKGGFAPCTAKACIAILDHYGIPLEGKHVVVIGRSQVIGKPVALMALERHATVSICHSRTADLASHVREADIVIAAAGHAHMITDNMVKSGAVVIDVGINELDGKTVGDVDYVAVSKVASAITPVPGGVGSVTTTMMLEAVFEAYHA